MHNHRHLFNMDISGGQPALVIQMLVGSDIGEINLLPALPEQWTEGSIEGVLCRGGIEIHRLGWKEGEITCELTSRSTQEVEVSIPGRGDQRITVKASLKAGEKASLSFNIQ